MPGQSSAGIPTSGARHRKSRLPRRFRQLVSFNKETIMSRPIEPADQGARVNRREAGRASPHAASGARDPVADKAAPDESLARRIASFRKAFHDGITVTDMEAIIARLI